MTSASAIEREDRLCVKAIIGNLADVAASITPFKHLHAPIVHRTWCI
jgi:hypothetical protein